MAYKIFLDTNIIIDYFLKEREGHENAVSLFTKIIHSEVIAFTSESVVNTSTYLLSKHISNKKLSEYFDEMLTFISILPSNNETFHKAYLLNFNDLEDAVLFQIAFDNKLDYFLSSDKNFTKSLTSHKMPIIKTQDFLEL